MAQAVFETNDRRIFGTFKWTQVAVIGIVLGSLSYGLALLLGAYVVGPLLCSDQSLPSCSEPDRMASNIASVLMAIVGAGVLIRLQVHRAVGVALAVLISFWNLWELTGNLPWYEAAAWFAVLYAFGYLLFSNIFRIRLLHFAIIVAVAAILLVRWVAFL